MAIIRQSQFNESGKAVPKPEPEIDDRELLTDLLSLSSGLSQWEVDFIDNLDHWAGEFTELQSKKLQEIWEKHLG